MFGGEIIVIHNDGVIKGLFHDIKNVATIEQSDLKIK